MTVYRIGRFVPAMTLPSRTLPALVQYVVTYPTRAPRVVSTPAWV